MALDPNIILRAGEYKGPDVADTLERRAQIGIRNATLARAQRQEEEAAARTVRLGSIGAKVAKGDYAGGAADAAGAGDFETVKTIQGLEGDSLKRAYDIAQRTAPMLLSLKQFPPEQRAAALAKIAPDLIASGFKPDHISQIDTSESGLNAIGQSALTVAQQYENASKDRSYALDTDKFAYQQKHDADQLGVTRAGNYLSAGLLPPEDGGGAVPVAGGGAAMGGGGGAPVAGRTQYGWTPRARNGGDNTDAAVDAKIAGMAKALGVDPTAPLTNLSPVQIAQALALSEGGKGSIADRNNNPGNLRDPKTGAYRRFPTKDAGIQAAAAQVRRNLARGQTTIQTMVEGLPTGGGQRSGAAAGGGLAIIPGGKLDPKADKAPSGYRFTASGDLEPITGGPADKQGRQANLKPAPVAATKAYIDNRTSIRKIAAAFSAIDKTPDALGYWKGVLPNAITSRSDPAGVDARAKISDIGSLLIHDRSGAAVTISETPRLKPFVPEVSDTPEAARTKLRNLRAALEETNTDIADAYGEDQGYKFPKFRDGTLKAPTGSGNGGPRPGTVQDGYRFKGGNPASPQSWEKVK